MLACDIYCIALLSSRNGLCDKLKLSATQNVLVLRDSVMIDINTSRKGARGSVVSLGNMLQEGK
jgi:hypothetical protein